MYFMIDNYDSFVYNLYAYMIENGQEVLVRRADEVDFEELESLDLDGIIISPGPKTPGDAIVSRKILETYQGIVPILGVCLGHQLIGWHYGATVCHGKTPVHGKISSICHDGTGLFRGLPRSYKVTRYHSLIVDGADIPKALRVTASTEDGIVMGLKHEYYPIYGVQFHPEAVLTEFGHEILQNFHEICQDWRQMNRRAVV